MSVIAKQPHILTLIIMIEVEPRNCDALLDLITGEMTNFVRRQPGFISANLHRNAGSTRLRHPDPPWNQGEPTWR
jgi:hypothetical protein